MQTLVAEILAAWRRAERLSHELPADSAERAAAVAACDRLKLIYRDLTGTREAQPLSADETRTMLAEIAKDLSATS